METPKKRKIHCAVSEIDEPIVRATVCGVVVELSPVKLSQKNPANKYFNGKLSDGKKTVKMVAFDVKLHQKLEKARQECLSVEISNCNIKEASRISPEYEIFLNSYSQVTFTPAKKFTLPDDPSNIDPDASKSLSELKEIDDMAVDQHITVVGKIIDTEDVSQIHTKQGKILNKQDCTWSDTSATVRVVLWNDDTEKLIKGQSYQLENVSVKLYGGVRYLSVSKSSSMKVVEDIGEVIVVCKEDLPPLRNRSINGSIVGVASVDLYRLCIACNAKVEAVSDNNTIVQCSKCSCRLKLEKCSKHVREVFI